MSKGKTRRVGQKPFFPIIRVGAKDALDMLKSKEFTLLCLKAGHAELISRKDGGAFAYVTQKTLAKMREEGYL